MREAAGRGQPTAAGVCDFLAGGHDHFGADRELAGRLLAVPGTRGLAGVNRRFVLRAVTWVSGMLAIDQFADLGCGLPLVPAVHDAAREGCPGATVVYADHDAAVMSHTETMCWSGTGLGAVLADVSDPAAVLEAAGMTGLLDLARPACLVFGATLSAMAEDVARDAIQGYAAALAPGSAVIISCASYDDRADGERVAGLLGGQWHNHDRETVQSFFSAGRLRLVRGKVADVRDGLVECAAGEQAGSAAVIGGIGIRD